VNNTYPVVDDSKLVDGTSPFTLLAYSFMIRYYEPDHYIHTVTPSGGVTRRMGLNSYQFKPLLCVPYNAHRLHHSEALICAQNVGNRKWRTLIHVQVEGANWK